jgi:hypothetical protein
MRGCCNDDGLAAQSGYSSDGGATWHRFGSLENGSHPTDLKYGNIAVSANDDRNLVWVPSGKGQVRFTVDGGGTWIAAQYPGRNTHSNYYLRRHVLTADPLTPGTFYALDENGVVRSSDGGATWQFAANNGLPPKWSTPYNATLTAIPGRAHELMLAVGPLQGTRLGMFRSRDGGDTWTAVPGIDAVGTFGFGKPATPDGPPVLFATAPVDQVAGVWRSDDLGETWTLLSSAPLDRYQRIDVVAGDPDVVGTVYLGYSGMGFVEYQPS